MRNPVLPFSLCNLRESCQRKKYLLLNGLSMPKASWNNEKIYLISLDSISKKNSIYHSHDSPSKLKNSLGRSAVSIQVLEIHDLTNTATHPKFQRINMIIALIYGQQDTSFWQHHKDDELRIYAEQNLMACIWFFVWEVMANGMLPCFFDRLQSLQMHELALMLALFLTHLVF